MFQKPPTLEVWNDLSQDKKQWAAKTQKNDDITGIQSDSNETRRRSNKDQKSMHAQLGKRNNENRNSKCKL